MQRADLFGVGSSKWDSKDTQIDQAKLVKTFSSAMRAATSAAVTDCRRRVLKASQVKLAVTLP